MSHLIRSLLGKEESLFMLVRMGKPFHLGTWKRTARDGSSGFPIAAFDTWPSSEKLYLERSPRLPRDSPKLT